MRLIDFIASLSDLFVPPLHHSIEGICNILVLELSKTKCLLQLVVVRLGWRVSFLDPWLCIVARFANKPNRSR